MSENRIELAIGGTIVVNDVNYNKRAPNHKRINARFSMWKM